MGIDAIKGARYMSHRRNVKRLPTKLMIIKITSTADVAHLKKTACNLSFFSRTKWLQSYRALYESLSCMRYNVHSFLDASFLSVPTPYILCGIILILDSGKNEYASCMIALLIDQDENLQHYLFLVLGLKGFDSKIWNISKQNPHITDRAKYGFEGYKRCLEDYFMNLQPNLGSFVSVLKK
ncbi:hypothetical protein HZS_773 [Henneguya salminicola]|nr:hypothetical protein HZS_773 [Henneguya salminicola]